MRKSDFWHCYTDNHVTTLKYGDADAPYNVQRQTETDAKQKDQWE